MNVLVFCAEALATYLVITTLSALFIWGFNGFSEVGQLIMLGTALVAIPGAIRIARSANLRSLLTR
jgi:hypothetical protein